MKELYQKSLERMQSEDTIAIAKMYYKSRDIFVLASEISAELFIKSNKISFTRDYLRREFGWEFERSDGAYRLVAINPIKKAVKPKNKKARAKLTPAYDIFKPDSDLRLINSVFC